MNGSFTQLTNEEGKQTCELFQSAKEGSDRSHSWCCRWTKMLWRTGSTHKTQKYQPVSTSLKYVNQWKSDQYIGCESFDKVSWPTCVWHDHLIATTTFSLSIREKLPESSVTLTKSIHNIPNKRVTSYAWSCPELLHDKSCLPTGPIYIFRIKDLIILRYL